MERKSFEIYEGGYRDWASIFEVSEEKYNELPENLREVYYHPIVNGEPCSMKFVRDDHLFFCNALRTHQIPQYFGPKAEDSFEEFDDPEKWYLDYFDEKREIEEIYGIPTSLDEPFEEIEGLVITEINGTTVELIRDYYGFGGDSSSEEKKKEEEKSLLL